MSMKKFSLRALGRPSLIACALAGAGWVHADEAAIEPQALGKLQDSMSYLGNLKLFQMQSQSSIEVVMQSGQKIMFDNSIVATIQRPDKMHTKRQGDLLDQEFFYDGKTLTLFDGAAAMHATVEAPNNLDDMLDFSRETLNIIAPAGDFIHADAFEILTEDLQSGFVVGTSYVEGTNCDHLAFSAPGTDWQIWIERGDKPLPRRLVITSRDVLNAPQFTVNISKWDLAPKISAGDFRFKDRGKTTAIEFLTQDSAAR